MIRRLVVVAVLALAFVACGWDWTVVPKADADASTTQDGSVVDGGADAKREGGKGTACRSKDDCAADELCVFPDFRCGAGLEGACYPPYSAKDCPYLDGPVCGCDGQTATDRCLAEANRLDVSSEAKCPAPAGTFRCGFAFCNSETEYCFEVRTPELSDFVCLPWRCAEKSCACPETKEKCKISSCSDGNGPARVVCTELEEK